ncbi:MAG: hypothetical protein FWE14_04065 [Lachnospiraceae bacterium]|nr:hypothetical protein [Lachnospiraceae bacterium]
MKKSIIIIITIAIIIAASITIFILTAPNTRPLYGKFTYINEDGSTAVITLTESTFRIENLDSEEYKNLEKGAAFTMTYDFLLENGLSLELGDEFGEVQQGFMENMNFASLYENKEVPISEIIYDEVNNAYDYSIRNPLDGSPDIWLWVDINRKEMYIGSKVFAFSR